MKNKACSELFKYTTSIGLSAILLIPIGKIDIKIIQALKDDLSKVFKKGVLIGKGMSEPHYAYHKKRKQYLSTMILNAILEQNKDTPYEKVLGVVDHDLFVPEFNFVFGQASPKAAVISITRLRQSFYHLPEDENLFYQRILTEAVHELGHTFGITHCGNPHCVMFFSNSLVDTDRKGSEFCPVCKNKLQKISSPHP